MSEDRASERAGIRSLTPLAVPVLVTFLSILGAACTPVDDTAVSELHDDAEAAEEAARDAQDTAAENRSAPSQVTVVSPSELAEVVNEHADKAVVLKFWATWCVPCVEEMPKVIEFYNEHVDSDTVALVSVSADMPGTVEDTVIPFLEDRAVPFPVWVIDADGPDDIVNELGIAESNWGGTLPATFLLDPSGNLHKHWSGTMPEGALEEALQDLA